MVIMPALNAKLFDEIMELIESGDSLSDILKQNKEYPTRRIFYKYMKGDDDRIHKYARATSVRADFLFDQILEIADKQDKDIEISKDGIEIINHNIVNRNRLQIDSRKWVLSKMNPKKYGEKLDVTSDGESIGIDVKFIKRGETGKT